MVENGRKKFPWARCREWWEGLLLEVVAQRWEFNRGAHRAWMEFGVGVGILRRGKKRGVNILSCREGGGSGTNHVCIPVRS